MTLDFKKLVSNMIQTQMQIQHFQCRAQLFRRDEIQPEWRVAKKIAEEYGQNFLFDADWLLFFTGRNLTRDMLKEDGILFKIANAALGRAANSMAESDFKLVELGSAPKAEIKADQTRAEVRALVGDDAKPERDRPEDGNAAAVAAALSESVESPEPGEKFAFVKVTLK